LATESIAHTPGPWVVHQRGHATGDLWLDIGYRLPDGTERGPVCDITGKQYVEPHACDFRSAAEIKYLVTPEPEQWANARLIAAAPMLLEALTWAVEWMDNYEGQCMPEWREWATRGRAAIDATRPTAAEGGGAL
jgi:hypothetical protein